MKIPALLFLFLTPILLTAQNQPPTLKILNAEIHANQVQVTFDVADTEMDDLEILFYAAGPGKPLQAVTTNVTGDIGFPVTPGNNKQLTWDFGTLQIDNSWRVRIVADDLFVIDIQDIVNQVDSITMKEYMDFVEGQRIPGGTPDHLNEVKDSLFGHFQSLGLDTDIQKWPYGTYEAGNVIGNRPGLKNEAQSYIIDAHFDGVSNSPGADDNGSGVVGVMEAARILSQYHFNKSIRFIGFDLEEKGLIGSNVYVDEGIADGDSVQGVFNFEMIGYYTERKHTQSMPTGFNLVFPQAYAQIESDSFRGNFITNVANTNSGPTRDLFDTAAAKYVPGLKVVPVTVSGNGQTVPDLRRSDHASFWDAGYQALMLTDGADFRNANYHSPNDVSDSLNFTFMADVVKATIGAIAMGAEVTHATAENATLSYPAAVPDRHQLSQLTIAPNPVKNYLRLHSGQLIEGDLTVAINDISGRMVKQIKIRDLHGLYLINVSDLVPGNYILRAENTGGNSGYPFIIK